MIFQTPALPKEHLLALANIDKLREQLRFVTSNSLNRWTGFLARMTYARVIHGSNVMEGINITIDDAVAAINREEPMRAQDEHWHALVGFREAMDYIIQLAKEPQRYQYSEGTILALHYMMMKYDMTKNPGRWRPGGVSVTNDRTGDVVYEGPDVTLVPGLMGELLTYLNTDVSQHAIIRAAMAHLNLTLIHPFRDGNGRMARALQTFVLANEGILSPVFSSIEEYVGRNTQQYYDVLARVGQGSWHPNNDALPWIEFCLRAHYEQAKTLLRRVEEGGKLVALLAEEVKKRRLNERVLEALIDAAVGISVKNPTYRQQADVTDKVATLDLMALVTAGLLEAKGERRWRHYVATDHLKELRAKTRIPVGKDDPFTEAVEQLQPTLPGMAQ